MAQPRSNNHRVAPAQRPRVETNHAALQNPRYSYLETPVEMQRSQFQQFSSPTNSAIDESPMSPPESLPNFSPAAPVNPVYEPDKHPGCPPTPRKDAHPAFYAPYAEDATMRQSNPRIPHGMVQPPDAHAAKTPNGLMKVESKQNGQPNGHRPTNGVTSPKPIYNPDSLGGPNFGAENHFPGQASHPNAHRDPEWKHGLCEPSAVCCMGILCPCVLYGKTQYRITKKTNKDDATDMLGYESVNGSCGLMGLACGLQWLLASIQRARVRKLYHINGSFGSDCLTSLCCCCCVLAQDEREVRSREELIRINAGPATAAYVSPAAMTYAPPPK